MKLSLNEPADWMSPVAIKEVRQVLRGRAFGLMLGGLLTLCVFFSLVVWTVDREADQSLAPPMDGSTVLWFVGVILAIVSCIAVPTGAGRTFTAERSDETWWTLILTGLTPRQIMRGKIVSALIQGMLFACVAGPFLLFGYFLQGVSLADIFTMLVVLAVGQLFFATVTVSLATFSKPGSTRRVNLFGAFVAIGGYFLFNMMFMFLGGGMRHGPRPLGMPNWPTAIMIAMTALSLALVVMELGAGRLALSTTNTTGGSRLALLLHLAIVLYWPISEHGDTTYVTNSLVYGCIVIVVLGLVGLMTPDAAPPGLRTKPRWSWVLLPGALNGWHFSMAAAAIWTFALMSTWRGASADDAMMFANAPCLVAFYLGIAAVARARASSGQQGGLVVSLLLAILLFTAGGEMASVTLHSHRWGAFVRLMSLIPSMPVSKNVQLADVEIHGQLLRALIALFVALLAEWNLRARERKALAP